MAAITTAAIGLAATGYQIYNGEKQKREAEKEQRDYERQSVSPESSPYNNIQISSVGSDALREENQRASANTINSLAKSGTRGLAMLPTVVGTNNIANQEARSYLDDQAIKRDYALAGDKTALRGLQENREIADLEGLGQKYQVGRQDMWSGIRGVGSSLMYAANNNDWGSDGGDIVDPLENSINPAGPKASMNASISAPRIPSNYSQMVNSNYRI
jgi:hypothetical protein